MEAQRLPLVSLHPSESLNLSGQRLEHLPMQPFSTLQELILNHNQLTQDLALPLPSLQIYMPNNFLRYLSVNVWHWKALKVLLLDYNFLQTLPPEIGLLTSLEKLNLHHNNLTQLPPELGQLTSLEWLQLSDNQLYTLPREISNLAKLQWLDLRNNQLTHMPSDFSRLTSLRILHLSHNRLSSLPSLGNLKRLSLLCLDYNRLTYLPFSILELERLKSITFEKNQFRWLPKGTLSRRSFHVSRLLDYCWDVCTRIASGIDGCFPEAISMSKSALTCNLCATIYHFKDATDCDAEDSRALGKVECEFEAEIKSRRAIVRIIVCSAACAKKVTHWYARSSILLTV